MSNNIVPDCVIYNNKSSSDIYETAQLFANNLYSVYVPDFYIQWRSPSSN